MSDDYEKNALVVTERRIASRHKVNLQASVLITAVVGGKPEGGGSEEEQYFVLRGQLLDVSRSGLAIIISAKDHRELESLRKDSIVLRLLLPLPAQAIELEALLARFAEINQGDRKKVLLGAQITKMNEPEQRLFTEFIDQQENAG